MKHKIKRLLSLLLSLMMLTAALPTSIWAEETEFAQATGAEAELPNEPEETAEPELPVESPEATGEPELPSEPTKLPSEIETPEGTAEPTPQVTEEPPPTPEPEATYQAGVFVLVEGTFHAVWIEFYVQVVIDVFQKSIIVKGRRSNIDVIANSLALFEHGNHIHPTFFIKKENRVLLRHPFTPIAFRDKAGFRCQSPVFVGFFHQISRRPLPMQFAVMFVRLDFNPARESRINFVHKVYLAKVNITLLAMNYNA